MSCCRGWHVPESQAKRAWPAFAAFVATQPQTPEIGTILRSKLSVAKERFGESCHPGPSKNKKGEPVSGQSRHALPVGCLVGC